MLKKDRPAAISRKEMIPYFNKQSPISTKTSSISTNPSPSSTVRCKKSSSGSQEQNYRCDHKEGNRPIFQQTVSYFSKPLSEQKISSGSKERMIPRYLWSGIIPAWWRSSFDTTDLGVIITLRNSGRCVIQRLASCKIECILVMTVLMFSQVGTAQ